MKRTTISLPDDVAAALEREARRLRLPVSRVAREAIEARLGRTPGKQRKFGFIALGRSGYTDTSAKWDEILNAQWGRAIDGDRDR